MTELTPNIRNVKNQWLAQQVDVEYPTKESIAGREMYLAKAQESTCEVIAPNDLPEASYDLEEIFLVDFHRLTVMFSLLQSERWEDQKQQELIVEFLTQIIYSEPCQLYVAFKDGEPTAAAIVTESEQNLLISDIVIKSHHEEADKRRFAASILKKHNTDLSLYSDVYLEI